MSAPDPAPVAVEDLSSSLAAAAALKSEGNTHFSSGRYDDAASSYRSALSAIEDVKPSLILPPQHEILRASLWSNLGMCLLKRRSVEKDDLVECARCCGEALDALDGGPRGSSSDSRLKLRSKVLYRRARARAEMTGLGAALRGQSGGAVDEEELEKENTNLNAAARDLLDLMSFDKDNREANALLRAIRAQHGAAKESRGPMVGAVSGLRSAVEKADGSGSIDDAEENGSHPKGGDGDGDDGHNHDPRVKNLRTILGLLARDLPAASAELGRLGGAALLFGIAVGGRHRDASPAELKARNLALQALSAACSHGPFVAEFAGRARGGGAIDQSELVGVVSECCDAGSTGGVGTGVEASDRSDLAVHAVALLLRLVVHLDHSDDVGERSLSDADGPAVCRACVSALSSSSSSSPSSGDVDPRTARAALDLLSAWTTRDMDTIAAAAESAFLDVTASKKATNKKHAGPTEEELRRMKPRDFAAHKKRQYEIGQRRAKRSRSNVALFCAPETGGLTALVEAAARTDDAGLRREACAVLGRMWGTFEDGDDGDGAVKELVGPNLGWDGRSTGEEEKGLTIEEIKEEDDADELNEEGLERESLRKLERSMRRGHLTASLLLGRASVGAWSLKAGWSCGEALAEIRDLVESGNLRAMSVASEVVALAASVEDARSALGPLVSSSSSNEGGPLEVLLASDDREIRSGAASAVAKLGLADKEMSKDEGEMMGLLQVAAGLLEEDDDDVDDVVSATKNMALEKKLKKKGLAATGSSSSSDAVTATDRGIEVLSYLCSKTSVKEEIAHGFRASPASKKTVLERVVELATKRPVSSGASGSQRQSTASYGLASVFALLAVSVDTIKKEAFDGKEITAEQYDELQGMGKTEEEKELAKKEEDHDPPEAVGARIRKMGSAGAPAGLVRLAAETSRDGATDGATEMVVRAMCRMAVEESVRGAMVQQGCLTACIKVEDGESEAEKKIVRTARHTVAKLLISMNPTLLTSSQRMGSIPPLIALVRDSNATDLMQFEALMAVTNVGSAGPETKDRIVSERGIGVLGYAMFSDHTMVRRAATEAMSNLIPHPKMMEYLADGEKMKLWVAFASDFEENFECARAASGCLAMASQDPAVASTLCGMGHFKDMIMSLLECGNLELMHRVLVVLLNASDHGGKCRETVVSTGAAAFCRAYVESFQNGTMAEDQIELNETDRGLMSVTVNMAKEVVTSCS